MRGLATEGLAGVDGSIGDGRGCSLTDAQRARPVPERPILAVELRVFCLRCAWSAAPTYGRQAAFGGHQAAHPGAGTVIGVDYAFGHRFGPLGGKRGRGKGFPLPPLRMRSGKGPETAEAKARRIAAGVATRRRLQRERAAAGNAP